MTFYVDEEIESELPFELEEVGRMVAEAVLQEEKCPYEASVNFLLTDNQGIRELNAKFRNIDKETDVLSFPGIDYEHESDFTWLEERSEDYFDPDTGELMLGDIVISQEKVYEQAAQYGHSLKREFAFLIAHSMLHLCGYDHMLPEEAKVMEEKQEQILNQLGITRD